MPPYAYGSCGRRLCFCRLLDKKMTLTKKKNETDATETTTSGLLSPTNVIDDNVTAVFGDGAVNLKSKKGLVEALLCKECGD